MSHLRFRVVTSGLAGGPYLTTLNFQAGAAGNEQDIADDITTWLGALKPRFNNQGLSLVQPEVLQINDVTGEVEDEFTVSGIGQQGSNTETREWSAKQGIIAWRTGTFVDGTRLSGRTFMWGVTGDAGEQVPNETYRNSVALACNQLIINAAASGYPMVAVRRFREQVGLPGNPGYRPARNGSTAPITAAAVRPYWGVLRTRRQ